VRLHLANGKTFLVEATNNSVANQYIQSAELNGKPLTIPVVRWEQIQQGGTLKFVMGPDPSQWGADWHPEPLRP
jgi:putative alpha-1,2-mannosidase